MNDSNHCEIFEKIKLAMRTYWSLMKANSGVEELLIP